MKRAVFRSGLLLVPILLTFTSAEIGLRVLGISYPRFYRHDNLRGHRLNPGAEGWFRAEGQAYITINQDGWRDHDYLQEKAAQTVRIAVLGDSYAEAFQVDIEATFWTVLERALQANDCFHGRQVEVLNFGVSGYGTAQELVTLRHDVWAYAPDIILLAFFPGNDLRNNSKALEPDQQRPFADWSGGELRFDYTGIPQQHPGRFDAIRQMAYQYSRAYQLLSQAYKRLRTPIRAEMLSDARLPGIEAGVDLEMYHPPATPAWQEAWDITERLLLALHDDVLRHGKRLLVTIVSTGIQVHPDVRVREQFRQQHQMADLLYPNRRIAAFLQQRQIEVLSLAPLLQAYAENHQIRLHGFDNAEPGFGHWNADGHRLAGEALAAYLCEHP